ncbi:Response regulator transcription factor [Candidatus Hepatincolaceae symbiont of Richtersius coronifer]
MKILIIEDDMSLANNMKTAFKMANMQSDHALSGEEALEFLNTYTYDLLVLDVLLPDTNGLELLKTVRKNGVATPVLILSGLDDVTNKIEGLNQGADDYLTKPFDKNELMARLHAIIRRSKGHSSSIIKIGELEVHLDNKQVSAFKKNIPLTHKEYSILEILSLKKGKAVSKEHLLDQLYGGMEEPEPKIIDVFVCKIRKKIKKFTNQNYIATIWGQGYILDEPK